MARNSAVGRMSVGSLDDDQFYSAPSSRVVSRHLSLIPSQNLRETGHSTLPAPSPSSAYQASWLTHPSTSEPPSPESKRVPKQRPATPFAVHHHRSPRRHHFCPKSINRRLHRTFHGTSESIPILQPLANDSSVDSNGYRKNLVSSPGSPTETDCWSPAYAGARTPQSELEGSVLDNPFTINRQTADTIVCNIRAYLSNRRHNDCSSRTERSASVNKNSLPISRFWTGQAGIRIWHPGVNETATESYLVTADDIAGILDIVIAGIRSIGNDSSSVECLSMLLPKESLVKPIPNVDAIIPGASSIADPATTISSVQPSFSTTSCSDYHSRFIDTARTTFISRQSITEVI
ncbi:hypothetical protein F4811DRAFT_352004 [Daldinia bambusicola]|nr:hypothetical protein F4811DRAFT_352004 [Daldinia bambusicola]